MQISNIFPCVKFFLYIKNPADVLDPSFIAIFCTIYQIMCIVITIIANTIANICQKNWNFPCQIFLMSWGGGGKTAINEGPFENINFI